MYAREAGMGIVDETKLVTAVSELTRNLVVHGRGGSVFFENLDSGSRVGVRVVFEDHGPGIRDLTEAMRDGHSTIKSMGLGLPGSKRLVSEFDIVSKVGEGTRVTIVKWK
jgi:serine/threonine-protein kinase RsbT